MLDTSGDEAIPALLEYQHSALLNMEKEVLGLYVSGHPLDGYSEIVRRHATCDTRAVLAAGAAQSGGSINPAGMGGMHGTQEMHGTENADGMHGTRGTEYLDGMHGTRSTEYSDGMHGTACSDGQHVVVGGTIASFRTKLTKNNALMGFAILEDWYGAVEALVFPSVLERLEPTLRGDAIVLFAGRVSAREDEDAKLILDDAIAADPADRADSSGRISAWVRASGRSDLQNASRRQLSPKALYIRISGDEPDILIRAMYSALKYFCGRLPVVLYNEHNKTQKNLDREYWARPSEALLADLQEKFGADNVRIKYEKSV
jgi:DNA polymerase-3 subunit alpha